MSINDRFGELIESMAEGNKRAFAKMVNISPTVIENVVGTRQGNPSYEVLSKICANTNVSPDWLLTGEGEMLRQAAVASPMEHEDTRPRIPVSAAAGALSGFAAAVQASDCERVPVIKAFPEYDYTMLIKGDSMEPKFEGGDEVAIKRVSSTIEWGKTYVLDTRDGAVIKRLYDAGDKFRCVSYNKEYPDFTVDKSEVFGVYKVVGLIRI